MCACWLVGVFFYHIQLSFILCLIFREACEQAETAKLRAERPKIQQQFTYLKRGLSVVTDEEWEGIPELAISRGRNGGEKSGRMLSLTVS